MFGVGVVELAAGLLVLAVLVVVGCLLVVRRARSQDDVITFRPAMPPPTGDPVPPPIGTPIPPDSDSPS